MFLKDFYIGIKFVIIAGVLAHILGLIIPKDHLDYGSFPFKAFTWEKNGSFYNRFHVSKWMVKMPDMSRIVPYMFRKKLDKDLSSEHILKYIRETCLAELVHIILVISSLLLPIIVKGARGAVFMLLYAAGNLPFIIIQRYNRPKLVRLYQRQLIRENATERIEANEGADTVV